MYLLFQVTVIVLDSCFCCCVHVVVVDDDDDVAAAAATAARFYIELFSAVEQTYCALVACNTK